MDDFAERVYRQEVAVQAKLALYAAAHVNRVHQSLLSGANIPQSQLVGEIFRGLHSMLTHASNVSRLLWPPPPKKKKGETKEAYKARHAFTAQRGAHLRQLLSLPEQGHVLQDRKLRDHLEHFDERLDDWQRAPGQKAMIDWNIGPELVDGVSAQDRLRNFNPNTSTFTFRGEDFDLQPLVDALGKLAPSD